MFFISSIPCKHICFVSILAKKPSKLAFQEIYALELLLVVLKVGNHFGMWLNIIVNGQIS